ncbi:MAG TPA: hypothetical protein PLH39_02990 [Promineifilum sp.]|nr:hypothetical protein [Promineifilum sp.]
MTPDHSTPSMIVVRDFTKRYGDFTAVDDIRFWGWARSAGRSSTRCRLALAPYVAGIISFT